MNYLKEIKKAFVIGIVIFLGLQIINFVVNQKLPGLEDLKWNFIFTMLYTVALYAANAVVFFQLDKHF